MLHKEEKKILVTCGLPYANGMAHLGHMRTYVPADVYVRSLRKMNKDVLFICGSDTHGTPISVNAEKLNISPKELVLKYHNHFKSIFEKMNINFDIYGSTDDENNHIRTIEIINKNEKNGYIYSKYIDAAYCCNCNRYLPDRYLEGICIHCGSKARGDECDQGCGKPLEFGELINPVCTICKKKAEYKKQKHYYFKLSEFQSEIKNFLSNLKGTENAINYAKGWVNNELKDWCITRNLNWGIKYPNSDDLVVYVWVDAPIGYISFTEEILNKKHINVEEYWKNNNGYIIHFIGGDIIYHHCIFWPALLIGSGYSTPNCVIASGMVKVNNKKFSKSRGYVIWVEEDYIKQGFHTDMLRYYLTCYTSHTKELNFSWKIFQEKINTELVSIFCNFIYRTLYFINKYCPDIKYHDIDKSVFDKIKETLNKSKENVSNFDFKKYVDNIMDLAIFGNVYIQSNEPWKTYLENEKKCMITLINSLQIVKALCILFSPIMPSKMKDVWTCIGYNTNLDNVSFDSVLTPIFVDCKINIKTPEMIFEKIKDEKIKNVENILNRRMEEAIKKENNDEDYFSVENDNMKSESKIITIEDFEKIEIKMGKIISVESIEKSNKLYKIMVDLGEKKFRQIISGLKKHYTKEELIGKNVCVISNLKPAILCGFQSDGMILACEDNNGIVKLITSDVNDMTPGSKIC